MIAPNKQISRVPKMYSFERMSYDIALKYYGERYDELNRIKTITR